MIDRSHVTRGSKKYPYGPTGQEGPSTSTDHHYATEGNAEGALSDGYADAMQDEDERGNRRPLGYSGQM